MILGKKLVVVLPAYNAAKTIEKTYKEIPFDIVDDVILVDDRSSDNAVEVGNKLNIEHIIQLHVINRLLNHRSKSVFILQLYFKNNMVKQQV